MLIHAVRTIACGGFTTAALLLPGIIDPPDTVVAPAPISIEDSQAPLAIAARSATPRRKLLALRDGISLADLMSAAPSQIKARGLQDAQQFADNGVEEFKSTEIWDSLIDVVDDVSLEVAAAGDGSSESGAAMASRHFGMGQPAAETMLGNDLTNKFANLKFPSSSSFGRSNIGNYQTGQQRSTSNRRSGGASGGGGGFNSASQGGVTSTGSTSSLGGASGGGGSASQSGSVASANRSQVIDQIASNSILRNTASLNSGGQQPSINDVASSGPQLTAEGKYGIPNHQYWTFDFVDRDEDGVDIKDARADFTEYLADLEVLLADAQQVVKFSPQELSNIYDDLNVQSQEQSAKSNSFVTFMIIDFPVKGFSFDNLGQIPDNPSKPGTSLEYGASSIPYVPATGIVD